MPQIKDSFAFSEGKLCFWYNIYSYYLNKSKQFLYIENKAQPQIPNISERSAMYDYSYVLALLRAEAADLRSRVAMNRQAEVANRTTERTLRNRAKAICLHLLDLPEARRPQYVEAAIRHL